MANIITDQEIYDTLMAGKKIQAIKLYKEKYNLGLKESKDAVEKMQKNGLPKKTVKKKVTKKKIAVKKHKDEEIHNALRDDRKILAIKLYRAKYGVGLKEAKTAVEAIPESFYKKEENIKSPVKKAVAKKIVEPKIEPEIEPEEMHGRASQQNASQQNAIKKEEGLDDYIPKKNSILNKVINNGKKLVLTQITHHKSNIDETNKIIDERIKKLEFELSKL